LPFFADFGQPRGRTRSNGPAMAWTTAPVELFVAYLERLLAAADQAFSGDCRSCGAPHSRGAAYCWKCGQPLMSQATSAALIEPLETS
jgi:hypothetical protein